MGNILKKKLIISSLLFIKFLLIVAFVFLALGYFGNLITIFGDDYNLNNLPPHLKNTTQKFIDEGTKRNVDISKIYKTKFVYLDWKISPTSYAGACNPKKNVIYLPKRNISEITLFHELGHCVLNYDHYYEKSNNNKIMYYQADNLVNLDLTKEMLDDFFKKAPKKDESEESIVMIKRISFIVLIWLVYILIETLISSRKEIIEMIKKQKSRRETDHSL